MDTINIDFCQALRDLARQFADGKLRVKEYLSAWERIEREYLKQNPNALAQ